jgi:hypothetical protein
MATKHRANEDLRKKEIKTFVKETRELIWPERKEDSERKAYDPRLVAAFGGDAGIYLGQCLYWTGKGAPDGSFYKSGSEAKKETGLSVHRQAKARKRLIGSGVLEEYRVSRRRPMHFRVNLLALAEMLEVPVPEYLELGLGTEYLKLAPSTENSTLALSSENLMLDSGTSKNTSERTTRDYSSGDPLLQSGGDGFLSRAAPTQDSEASSPSGDSNDAPALGDALQKRSVKEGVVADQQLDLVAVPPPDPARVSEARDALRDLLDQWPGYRNRIEEGKWWTLSADLVREGYATEQFSDIETQAAADTLGRPREEVGV